MDDRNRGRSAAQWFCIVVGATLVVVGLFGFLAEATFDTSAGSDPGALLFSARSHALPGQT